MTPRIAILCNDRLCLPAVNWLISSGIAVAVGMPAAVQETSLLLQQQCAQSGIPFTGFDKKEFSTALPEWLAACKPDLVLVKTFPWKIPEEALEIPALGFINFHYAPLPAYRGPHPLFWMVRNRVEEGAVTVHQMDKNFDSGPVLLQQRIGISADLTYGWLCTRLAFCGLELTWALLQALAAGPLPSMPQNEAAAKWFSRPKPEDLFIAWERMTATDIRALVLACNPWNRGAATVWNNWLFGITDVSIVENPGKYSGQQYIPGTVVALNEEEGLLVSCLHHQLLKIEVIFCEEGFFPGQKLAAFGICAGHRLGQQPSFFTIPHAQPQNSLHQST